MARAERPLEGEDGPLRRFAADLRLLRAKVGSPAYRELSRRAHYSAAALSDAAGGRRLPSLAVTLAYVAACDGDAEVWTRRWHDVAADLATDLATTEPGGSQAERAPYVGLAVFQREDADRFFGRERLAGALVELVARRRFVVVVGPSGSGKSSLLRAGLAHHADITGVPGGPVLVMSPGPHPLEECAAQLAALVDADAGALHTSLTTEPRTLHLTVLRALVGRTAEVDALIVVDQFEEVFTLCADEPERARFLALLDAAARAANSRCRIVLGVRADFYAHCTHYPELVEVLRDAQVVVGPMSTAELRAAITEPALRAGYRVENALLSQLIADVTGQPGVLPLVSHALLETWRRRRGTTLTLNGYLAAGGIADAIARTAESVYAELTGDQQRWARQLFTRLVVVGVGTEDTKRRLDRAELDADDTVLDRLARARLVTLDRDSIEIAHEALIRGWPRLREWLTADRDGLRTHRELTEAAGAWVAARRDDELLYRGNRLSQVERWATTADGALSTREREFLRDSIAAQANEQAATRRQTRRLRVLLALATILLIVATGTTGFALRAQRAAAGQRTDAVVRNALGQADALRTTNPALALQLRLAAYRIGGVPEAREGLLNAFATPYAARLTGHTDVVQSVAFNPVGDILATAGNEGTVRLWSAGAGHPRELAKLDGFPGVLGSVTFSPDGGLLAAQTVGSAEHSAVRLFDVRDPGRPRELPSAIGDGFAVGLTFAFSPDGDAVFVGGAGPDQHGLVRAWNIADPGQPTEFATGGGPVTQLAFGPNHLMVTSNATAPDYQTTGQQVRLWDASDLGRPVELAAIPGIAQAASELLFSPDGRTLAVEQGRTTLGLWDVTDPRRPQALPPLTGFTGAVRAAAFSPDGHTLATGMSDRTTRVWDMTDVHHPRLLTTLTGPTAGVVAVDFSPDGQTLAVGSVDMAVRLEDVSQFGFAGRAHGAAYAAAFSADGRTMATGNADGTIGLWSATDPYRPRPLGVVTTGTRQPVQSVAFGPDSHTVAAAGVDGIAGLWDVSDPRRPRLVTLLSPGTEKLQRPATAVALSPDGHTMAVGYADNSVLLWEITDPRHVTTLGTINGLPAIPLSLAFERNGRLAVGTGGAAQLWDVRNRRKPRKLGVTTSSGKVNSVAFGPGVLATANGDHKVGLWDAAGRPRATIPLNTTVFGVAVSADGRTLAAGTADHTLWLWDIRDSRRPRQLAALSSPSATNAVTFGPNGVVATTGGEDLVPGAVPRLWDTDPARIAKRVCAVAWPAITPAEWRRYLPGIAYRPPCP